MPARLQPTGGEQDEEDAEDVIAIKCAGHAAPMERESAAAVKARSAPEEKIAHQPKIHH